MKKNSRFLLLIALVPLFSGSISCSKSSGEIIQGKWELKSIGLTHQVKSPLFLAFYEDLNGMIFEFKNDGAMQMSLAKAQLKNSKLTSSPDKYYLIREGDKDFLIQIEKGEEEKFEILKLDPDTLKFSKDSAVFLLVRLK